MFWCCLPRIFCGFMELPLKQKILVGIVFFWNLQLFFAKFIACLTLHGLQRHLFNIDGLRLHEYTTHIIWIYVQRKVKFIETWMFFLKIVKEPSPSSQQVNWISKHPIIKTTLISTNNSTENPNTPKFLLYFINYARHLVEICLRFESCWVSVNHDLQYSIIQYRI